MEQTKEIPVAWRDFIGVGLVAALLHIAAWCFWWGVEGRTELVSATLKSASISSPASQGPQVATGYTVVANNTESQPVVH